MLRESLPDFKGLDHDPDFRWRGTNVTRIENLSDIVFAIALGMLITGVDAPRTLFDLRVFLINIAPTFLGFTVLLGLWNAHYTFFRRYGVADRKIIVLNALLIFIVLFMAYPLRFAFDSLVAYLTSLSTGDYSRAATLGLRSIRDAAEIITYFSLFYAAAFAVFALMQSHVLRKSGMLMFNAHEFAISKRMHFARWVQCTLCLICSAVSYFTPIGPAAAVLLSTFGLVFWVARRRYPTP